MKPHLHEMKLKNIKTYWGTSPVVQWLRLCIPNAGDMGSVPDLGTKIVHATGYGQKILKRNLLEMFSLKQDYSSLLIIKITDSGSSNRDRII